MQHRQKMKWYIFGLISALLVANLVAPALASFWETIQVESGVTVYIDDVKLDPKDANGNTVEVFIYNGTTYLPIRAVSGALGIPIQWDEQTESVYVGKHTADNPAVWVSDLDYFDRSCAWSSGTTKDNLGVEHTNSIYARSNYNNYITYRLNGQYSRLSGLYYTLYQYRSGNSSGTRYKPTLVIYADGEEIWKGTVGAGTEPIAINVDVTGVLELKFYIISWGSDEVALGDLGLWT